MFVMVTRNVLNKPESGNKRKGQAGKATSNNNASLMGGLSVRGPVSNSGRSAGFGRNGGRSTGRTGCRNGNNGNVTTGNVNNGNVNNAKNKQTAEPTSYYDWRNQSTMAGWD